MAVGRGYQPPASSRGSRPGGHTASVSFKRLTANNWDEPDETSSIWVRRSRLVPGEIPVDGNAWARKFLAVELTGPVPTDVADLFEGARGTLLYGWFYYPLYAIGEEQLHRVADTAVATRYQELAGPTNKRGHVPSFVERIKWLVSRGVIAAEREHQWEAIRVLRNIGTHPRFQALHTPNDVLRSLEIVADFVSALFAPGRTTSGPQDAPLGTNRWAPEHLFRLVTPRLRARAATSRTGPRNPQR